MKRNYLANLFLALGIAVCCMQANAQEKIQDFAPWKFKTGNSQEWQKPNFDDSSWKTIDINRSWEGQGYTAYDGMGVYRSSIVIPSSFKNDDVAEGMWLYLGYVDDRDSVFLNGDLIGTGKFWRVERNYFISKENKSIKWDRPNSIVVKVMDDGGGGGMYSGIPYIASSAPIDFINIGIAKGDFTVSRDGHVDRTIQIISSSKLPITGKLKVKATSLLDDQVIYTNEEALEIPAKGSVDYDLNFKRKIVGSCRVDYEFVEDKLNGTTAKSEDVPYILTPTAPAKPEINGTTVYGVRPGNPVIYRVPVTGDRPMKITVNNLPKGLQLKDGILTGCIQKAGDYTMEFCAENAEGKAKKSFTVKVGGTISLTPPLGWNSWNCWGLEIDEEKVKDAANSFVSSGLANYGWTYINIDDGWEAPERDAKGFLYPNEKFKNMKGLADYVHSLGMKIGVYSSPGPFTCGGYLGSYQHEKQDVETWADWGIDYIKHDWCSYSSIVPNPNMDELKAPYEELFSHLKVQPRDIVFSLCQYGMGEVWKWGGSVGGNLWRTTGDIEDTWESMAGIGFNQSEKAPYAKPGNWNDPDMLVVGKLGWGDVRNNRLTPDEQYTHITLWSLLKSPLLIGCDLTKLNDFTLNLLCNNEVLAINQDPLGKQAHRIFEGGDIQIYKTELANGNYAIGIFNLNEKPQTVNFTAETFGVNGDFILRDAWRQQNEGELKGEKSVKLAPHGTKLYVLKKK